jgi:hypothetical protein
MIEKFGPPDAATFPRASIHRMSMPEMQKQPNANASLDNVSADEGDNARKVVADEAESLNPVKPKPPSLRVNLDKNGIDVYTDILDPETGDVMRRIPVNFVPAEEREDEAMRMRKKGTVA